MGFTQLVTGKTMTHPDLDELVRQARRDGPAVALLSSVARGLRLAFLAPPLRAVVMREASVALPKGGAQPPTSGAPSSIRRVRSGQ